MARGPAAPVSPNATQTAEIREFRGMNATDSRTTIEDTEFAWLENFIPVGKGDLRLVPPRGPDVGTPTAGSIATVWGFQLTLAAVTTPFLYLVHLSGAVTQINSVNGATTTVCGAGILSGQTRLAVWRDTHILFIDPTKGYAKWDGTTFTIIDAAKTGRAVAIFEGRAWLLRASRTIEFTAPNTFDDFTGAAGAGVVTVTDSAFVGAITELESALQQLWIVGSGAINAISNVVTAGSPLITTFSITNIVSNVGSPFPSSVTSFLRTFLMLSPIGVYAIVGATPQKLSDKLDGLFPRLLFQNRTDWSAAVGNIYNVFIWAVHITLRDPIDDAISGTDRPILLCFAQGKWFLANQDPNLTFITSLTSTAGRPEIWGTDGLTVFKLFGGVGAVPYRIKTKLYAFGSSVQWKEWLRFGLEFTSDAVVTPEITLETERHERHRELVNISTALTFFGAGPITFVGTGPITFIATGLQLVRQTTGGLKGRYLGMTLQGIANAWVLAGLQMQVKPVEEWT